MSDASPAPIRHTVVFRLHAPADSPEAASFLDDARGALTSIPLVQDFMVARQVSLKSDLDWQFSMRFADRDAYAAYDAHPVHRRFVAERWDVEVAQFQEFDFVEP